MDFKNFISPSTGHRFEYKNNTLETKIGETIEIIKKIPRFSPNTDYTSAFGRQWKIYSEVQLDSKNKTTLSEDRIRIALGKPLDSIKDLKIIEAGSGAGRFTKILLKYGAKVYSFDLSEAVDANLKNNSGHPNLTIF